MLRSVWKKIAKKKKKGGGDVGHDPMYLCVCQDIQH